MLNSCICSIARGNIFLSVALFYDQGVYDQCVSSKLGMNT